jgi:hypothetical protein
MPPVDVKYAWAQINGQTVSVEADVLAVTEKIQAYDPNLKVQFLNDAARGVSDPPYRIVEKCKDGVERIVFSVWTLDDTVLQRVFAADNQKFDVLGITDSVNARAKQREQQRYKDKLGEAREITTTVLRSNKDTFSVPANVIDPEDGSASEKVIFRATPGEHGSTDRKKL